MLDKSHILSILINFFNKSNKRQALILDPLYHLELLNKKAVSQAN